MELSFLIMVLVWYLCPLPTSSCPERCRCVTATSHPSADCSYQELTSVPIDLPFNLTQLSLSVNYIIALNTSSFSSTLEITSLWLAHNQIITIDPGTFRSLTKLRNLDVSHNQLLDFPWSDLSSLYDLQILILNNNRLRILPSGTFWSSSKLRSLQLSNNNLSTLSEGTFDTLFSLSHLQLHSNPFNCSCQLMWLKEWLVKPELTIDKRKEIACSSPKKYWNVPLDQVPDVHCKIPLAMQSDDPFLGKINLLCSKVIMPSSFEVVNTPTSKDYREIEVSVKVFANGTISITPIKREMIYVCHFSNQTGGVFKERSISLTHLEGTKLLQKQEQKLLLLLVSKKESASANTQQSTVPLLFCLSALVVPCHIYLWN